MDCGELLAARTERDGGTIVKIGENVRIGRDFCVIAGPCAIESEEQLERIAKAVSLSGASAIRGGAYKARTSPYDFQGLGRQGIELLTSVGRRYNMPTVTEITDTAQVREFDKVDVIQIGARNMQNFPLLLTAADTGKPILLKRGFGSTLEELILSAEYILRRGNPNVILCERGIRSFSSECRYMLDLSAVPVLKSKTHLPVIVDPSHAAGSAEYVPQLSLAAVAAGADGLIIEVHDAPCTALCDARQAISPDVLADIIKRANGILPFAIK